MNSLYYELITAADYASNPGLFYMTEEQIKNYESGKTAAYANQLRSAEKNKFNTCTTLGCTEPRYIPKSGIVRGGRCEKHKKEAQAEYRLNFSGKTKPNRKIKK